MDTQAPTITLPRAEELTSDEVHALLHAWDDCDVAVAFECLGQHAQEVRAAYEAGLAKLRRSIEAP